MRPRSLFSSRLAYSYVTRGLVVPFALPLSIRSRHRWSALTGKVRFAAFGLGGLIAATTAWLYAPLYAVGYMTGAIPGIKGFIALFIGGLASPLGPLVGGILLGLLEVSASRYLPSIYPEGIAFALLMLVLFVRPDGLIASPRSGEHGKSFEFSGRANNQWSLGRPAHIRSACRSAVLGERLSRNGPPWIFASCYWGHSDTEAARICRRGLIKPI